MRIAAYPAASSLHNSIPLFSGVGNLDLRFEVEYKTEDIEAKAGDDYEATSGTLVFEVGDKDKNISVNIVDDDEFEPTERFRVTLFNPKFITALNDSPTAKVRHVTLIYKLSTVEPR